MPQTYFPNPIYPSFEVSNFNFTVCDYVRLTHFRSSAAAAWYANTRLAAGYRTEIFNYDPNRTIEDRIAAIGTPEQTW